jgi:hypothetical protein
LEEMTMAKRAAKKKAPVAYMVIQLESGTESVEDVYDCRWFLGCTREAVTTLEHPLLGSVPVCQRCYDFAK